MNHDAAHKYIYGLPEVSADLLRIVARDWVNELDLATIEDRSSEFLDDSHRKRIGDMVVSARLVRGRLLTGERPYVLVLVEFQSEVDGAMAKRVRDYTEMLLDRVVRSGAPKREGGLPKVLPIVVYNGSDPWTAPGQPSDWAPLPSARMEQALAPLQPQAYHLLVAGSPLTSRAQQAEDWPLMNRVSATVRLQRTETGGLRAQLREEAVRFPGEANRAFRQALHAWARALWADKAKEEPGIPAFDEFERTGEEAMPTIAEANWDRWEAGLRAEGRKQGIRQGRAQGRTEGRTEGRVGLISRQVALKFGPRTAERLSGLLNGLTARKDLDQVGDWIIECDSGEELLSRLSALRAKEGTKEGN